MKGYEQDGTDTPIRKENEMASIKRSKFAGFGITTAVLVSIILLGSCNFGVPDYEVSVFVEEGVTGTPGTGTYTYPELTEFSFDYSPVDPMQTVEVLYSTSRTSSSGTITLYNNFSLTAQLIDIRGTWDAQMQWTTSSEVDFEFSITFVGADLNSGTFTDNQGNYGTWTNDTGTITISYTNWRKFVLIGAVFDMNGTFTAEGWSLSESNTGSWGCTRQE